MSASDSQNQTWHVTSKGSGTGFYASSIIDGGGGQIDLSGYTIEFEITETGEKFSQKFKSLSLEADGYKLGIGIYVVCIEGEGVFTGDKPTQEQIVDSFSGMSESIGVGFGVFGISGSDSGNWVTTSSTVGIGVGIDFSISKDKVSTISK